MVYDAAILILTAICALGAIIGSIPVIRTWVQPVHAGPTNTALPSKIRWLILLFIAALALMVSLLGLYRVNHYEGTVVHFPNTDVAHLKYVRGKHFVNEEVKVDGIHFDMCTFDNVTLTYDGTDVVATSNCRFNNLRIKTNSDPFGVTVSMLKVMGFIKPGVPVLDKDEKPIDSIPGSEGIH